MKTLNEVIERLAKIDEEVRTAPDAAKVDELAKEKNELLARKVELEELEQRKQTALGISAGTVTSTVVGTNKTEQKSVDVDKFDTMEYRKAFMEYCRTGKPVGAEYRLNAFTDTTEAAAMIPTTIMNEIIKEMKAHGQLYNRVRKSNIAGGVRVPILSLKPTASRITEAAPSDRKKLTANTYVSFSYLGLECKIATSLLVSTVSVPMFEAQIVPLITEAMVSQMEIEIVKGNGTTEMLGVAVDARVAAGQSITLSSAEFTQYDAWKKKVFAKIPLSYRSGSIFLMGAGTFDGYIDGMVDANGQPIGRTNYGITNTPEYRFGGKEVIEVEEDVIVSYDAANVGDVVGIVLNPSDYCINSNMQMSMYRWLDHDLNQWVDKAILINDGKLLDAAGVLLIKKGA